MKLINSLKTLYSEYPRQYWLMITGIVLSTAGGSMIWPFLVIYASSKLNMPLSRVAALISINAGTGLIFSLIAGTLADKVGCKVVMNFSPNYGLVPMNRDFLTESFLAESLHQHCATF